MLILALFYIMYLVAWRIFEDKDKVFKVTSIITILGIINVPIIKYSVEWWNTLHQPASFSLTEKPAMPAEMWLPLLVMVLGFYCFAGHNVLSRMRLEILRREANTRWVNELYTASEVALPTAKGT